MYNLRVRTFHWRENQTQPADRVVVATVRGYVYICTSEEEESPMRSLEEERKERERERETDRKRARDRIRERGAPKRSADSSLSPIVFSVKAQTCSSV